MSKHCAVVSVCALLLFAGAFARADNITTISLNGGPTSVGPFTVTTNNGFNQTEFDITFASGYYCNVCTLSFTSLFAGSFSLGGTDDQANSYGPNTGSIAAGFNSIDLTQLGPSGTNWASFSFGYVPALGFNSATFSGSDVNGNTYDASVADVTAIPEPGSMLLLGSGLAGIWMRHRRAISGKR